jgi:hypothetical protein
MRRAALALAWALSFVAYWADDAATQLCRWGRGARRLYGGFCRCYEGPKRRRRP